MIFDHIKLYPQRHLTLKTHQIRYEVTKFYFVFYTSHWGTNEMFVTHFLELIYELLKRSINLGSHQYSTFVTRPMTPASYLFFFWNVRWKSMQFMDEGFPKCFPNKTANAGSHVPFTSKVCQIAMSKGHWWISTQLQSTHSQQY